MTEWKKGYRGDPNKMITTTHAARYWGCDTETVRKGIKQGIIRSVKAEDGFLWIPQGELYRLKVLRPGTPHRIRVRPEYKSPPAEITETMVAEANTLSGHKQLDAEWQQKELAEVG